MSRILLIDDDPLVRSTLRMALEKADHTVDVAEHGGLGVAAMRDNDFDLVITDIIMPDQEGIETIIQIRRISADAKIIAISGGGRSERMDFLKAARSLGANRVLRKPFSPRTLIEAVDKCLAGETDNEPEEDRDAF